MVGLSWSLKSRGVIGSMVATVGVVGVIGGIVGVCAWQSAGELEVLGPALGALVPVTALDAIVDPVGAMQATVDRSARGLTTARWSLFIGSLAAAALYAGVVYGVHASMIRGFDFTVRRLAGNR
jgi:hypothetical protein